MLAGGVGLTALGGAGLAGNGDRVAGDLAGDGTGHQFHALPHQSKGGSVVLHHIHHFGLGLMDHLAGIRVEDGLDEVGTVAHTVVGQCSRISGQLNGGDHRIALTDGRLNVQ